MTALPAAVSPCRINRGEGRRHYCSTAHATLVDSYRAARHAWLLEADRVAMGYGPELADFKREHPPVTFRAWLRGRL